MHIRWGTRDDAAGIAEVHVRGWQEAYVGQIPQRYLDGLSVTNRTQGWLKMFESDSPPTVLLAEDDEIVAFMLISTSQDDDADEHTGEVPAIYARQRVWRTGIGRQLMEHGLPLLAASGHTSVTLWVLDTNDRARRFYEAVGWAFDRTTKDMDIGGATVKELRYRRQLTAQHHP